MIEHASALELDELVTNLAAAPVRTHVESCDSCLARLADLKRECGAVMENTGLQETLARLPTQRSSRSTARPGWFVWTAALGTFAAAALLITVMRPAPELRAKGTASLELLTETGATSSTPHVGDQVELKLAAGQYRYVFAIAIGEDGKTDSLWPLNTQVSGVLPPGGHASVPLRVTPGTVRVVAAFSNQPLSIRDVATRRASPGVEFIEREIRPMQ